jgi:putative transposase
MSRLRRMVLWDRYFFITCNLLRTKRLLNDTDFDILARVIRARRQEHGFILAAWVFLPDHWHAIVGVGYNVTISRVMESIKVSATRQINSLRKESGRLWQGRFFDRALRTVREYNKAVEYIRWNPVRRGLVKNPEEWPWSSYREYAGTQPEHSGGTPRLRIDRVRLPADPAARI